MNCKWEEAAWSRLAAYEDTGLTPGDIEELLDMAVSKTDKVLRLKEELHTMKNIKELINAIPAADVVEVVRCKDCYQSVVIGNVLHCTYWSKDTDENGYCHEGG